MTASFRGALQNQEVAPAYIGLTPRQGAVLALVLQGLPNKRIALILELSESTVKEHVSGILQRLGVGSRVQAITMLHRRGLTVAATELNRGPTTPPAQNA